MSKTKEENQHTVLAIDPTTRGCGYVVMERQNDPVDWGITDFRIHKNRRVVNKVEKLIKFHFPDVVVLEEPKKSLRCNRVQKLITQIDELCKTYDIEVVLYSRSQVKEVFAQFGASTKHEISTEIVKNMPELEHRLPSKRKAWMPEDERFGIFDATALAMTYFYLQE